MKFNVRHLLAWFAMVAVVLTILRRPLAWLLDNGVSDTWIVGAFLNAFRHLAWLMGAEVEYYRGSLDYGTGPRFTLLEFFALIGGCFVSLFVHVAIGAILWQAFSDLNAWANRRTNRE